MTTRLYYNAARAWRGANNLANGAMIVSGSRFRADPSWNAGGDAGGSPVFGQLGRLSLYPPSFASYGIYGGDSQQSLTNAALEPIYFRDMFISDPLDGDQTISGTVKGVIMATENTGTADASSWFLAYVISKDGTVRRGTLRAGISSGLEFAVETTAQSRYFPPPGSAVSSVNALDGDRIVVEVGIRTTNAGSGKDATLLFTTGATDLPENQTQTVSSSDSTAKGAAPRPWVEFSADLAFRPQQALIVGMPTQEPAAGAGAAPNVDPPTVTNISPASGSTLQPNTPIMFKVSHALGVAGVSVTALLPSGARESIYEPAPVGESPLSALYSASEVAGVIGDVELTFTLRRNSGWPADTNIRVNAVGANGIAL